MTNLGPTCICLLSIYRLILKLGIPHANPGNTDMLMDYCWGLPLIDGTKSFISNIKHLQDFVHQSVLCYHFLGFPV